MWGEVYDFFWEKGDNNNNNNNNDNTTNPKKPAFALRRLKKRENVNFKKILILKFKETWPQ